MYPITDDNYFGRYLEILTANDMNRIFLLEATPEEYMEIQERLIESMRIASEEVFDIITIEEFNGVQTVLRACDLVSFSLYPVMDPEDYEDAKSEMGAFPHG